MISFCEASDLYPTTSAAIPKDVIIGHLVHIRIDIPMLLAWIWNSCAPKKKDHMLDEKWCKLHAQSTKIVIENQIYQKTRLP